MTTAERWTRALGAVTRRYALPGHAAAQLESLLWLLVRDAVAPTTVRDPRGVLDDHLADSLVALELEGVRSASRLADLGSGAGLPALPLAIALPHAEFVLVESAARKCVFLRRAIRECAIENAHVEHTRVEAWRARLEQFDVVTARAVGPLEVVAEYASPLLRPGGALVVWRGQRNRSAEEAAALAADELGLERGEFRPVKPHLGVRNRSLYVSRKVGRTPDGFPRREGIARKRPLGRAAGERG